MAHPFMHSRHEGHRSSRVGWLRAAVLGANDGIVSTASLIVGVMSSGASSEAVLVAGTAGLVAGAMSMGAGEYVSVASQRDTEQADLELEKIELEQHPDLELTELAKIYEGRGLDPKLALEVAVQLTAHDVLAAHARDELGITEGGRARPMQAAVVSTCSFATGAALPLLGFAALGGHAAAWSVSAIALVCLAGLGAVGASLGGAPPWVPTLRVTVGGALAMASTAAIGSLFGVLV
jgi:VIT1/CCC1 family predicted Fe2+/Mn2+ transporter